MLILKSPLCYTIQKILNTEDTNMQQSFNNDLQIHLKSLNGTEIKEATIGKKNSSQEKQI